MQGRSSLLGVQGAKPLVVEGGAAEITQQHRSRILVLDFCCCGSIKENVFLSACVAEHANLVQQCESTREMITLQVPVFIRSFYALGMEARRGRDSIAGSVYDSPEPEVNAKYAKI